MGNPQQPEIARSRKVPSQDQDAVAGVIEGQDTPGADAPRGPVPPENQPGHHPEKEQDKPDLEAFAQKMGIVSETGEVPDPAPARNEPVVPPRGRFGLGWIGAVVAATVLAIAGILFTKRRRRS